MSALARQVESPKRLGPLPAGFSFSLTPGYTSLVGRNNAGKSSILQLLFRFLIDDPEFGSDRVAFVPADRDLLPTAMETGGRSLLDYNQNFVASIRGEQIWPNDGSRGSAPAEISRVLLTHTNYIRQVNTVDEYLQELGLPPMLIKGAQQLHFEDVQAHFQGSGVRALFPVLCALSDTTLQAILIDEPEASLQPGLQRLLRDLLVREAQKRFVVVATQSHLFINRNDVSSVCRVTRTEDGLRATRCANSAELLDVVYTLLGSSTEDLLLPGNFLVVEGASDQAILERTLELLGVPPGRVKVLASGGISKVEPTAVAIEAVLKPIITSDSPYARSIVAVIDQARIRSDVELVESLRSLLGERLVELPAESLEEYIPEELYAKAGMTKEATLINLVALKGDWKALQARKAAITGDIAAAMNSSDVDSIPEIRDAALRAVGQLDGR